jgi:guanosine-3',5'-bis(diphosphate) 3'-pyrophosphohydrolase
MNGMAKAEHSASHNALLLEAVAFATRAHRGQIRKDGQTPYVSHAFRVCLIVRDVFGIADRDALAAALLHDTIEDTTTDFDDLAERFGTRVAKYVAILSKDSRLPEEDREAAYCAGLSKAPWQAKVCKLADIYDNLHDSLELSAQQRAKTKRKARRYLEALALDLAPEVTAAWKTVDAFLLARYAGLRP